MAANSCLGCAFLAVCSDYYGVSLTSVKGDPKFFRKSKRTECNCYIGDSAPISEAMMLIDMSGNSSDRGRADQWPTIKQCTPDWSYSSRDTDIRWNIPPTVGAFFVGYMGDDPTQKAVCQILPLINSVRVVSSQAGASIVNMRDTRNLTCLKRNTGMTPEIFLINPSEKALRKLDVLDLVVNLVLSEIEAQK